MRRLVAALLTVACFTVAFFQLTEGDVSRDSLIQESGNINSVECRSGSRDGSPTIVLLSERGSTSYTVLEKFSRRTNCDTQKQNLIGKVVEVSILENQGGFAFAYEVALDGKIVYTLEDVVSSSEASAYTMLFLGLISLSWVFMGTRKDT